MQVYRRDLEVMTVYEASLYLRIAKATLNNWRIRGKGPPYLKLGDSVRYRLPDLKRWMDENTRQGTRDAKAKA